LARHPEVRKKVTRKRQRKRLQVLTNNITTLEKAGDICPPFSFCILGGVIIQKKPFIKKTPARWK
jgi:hypothetical protein